MNPNPVGPHYKYQKEAERFNANLAAIDDGLGLLSIGSRTLNELDH